MYRMAHRFLVWRGWTFEGTLPDAPKFVAVGAPHTTNFDFFVFLAVAEHFGFRASFIAKHSLFRWPFGGLMRRLGGIPVRRGASRGLVDQVAEAMRASETMVLVLAPEGTRSAAAGWRSGFYRIAEAAAVPIVAGFVDYPPKRAGLGPALTPSGDLRADIEVMATFYADKVGRHPRRTSPIAVVD